MFSSPAMGKSVDNLSPLSPNSRSEFPFHSRQGQAHGRPISRRGSTASSIHSIGGTLDTSTGGWGSAVYESGQNAISTLLQPPIVRTGLQPHTSAHPASTHKPPTARDIPPVTLTNVRKVENEEFSSYLSQVGALYEQLRRVRETEDDAPRPRRDSRNDDHAEDASDNHLRPGFKTRTRKGSTTSLSSLNSLDAPSPVRRSSSNFGRKGAQGPPPLSTIPTVYFDDNFQLENPRTFDVVSERSEVIRPTNTGTQNENGAAAAPRKALATNAILQEKLSWYMDTIEVHLINSISSASTTFFTALGSLKELHSEAADSVRRIKVLRQELETLDKEVAERGLETAQKQRRQENLYQLNEAVLQLRQIIEGVAHCETLVDGGDVEKALSSIDSLERLIAGERDDTTEDDKKPRLRDLRSASALRGVNADLSTLRFRIGKAYESQFCNALVSDLHQHADNVSVQDVLLRWSNAASRSRGGHARSPSVFPSYLARSDELRVQLMPVMRGLYRAKHIATAALTFREAALRDIRNIIRKPLPSSNDDDNESMMSVSTAGGNKRSNQEKSSILARNLRALDAEDAEEMLRTIYIGVTETLRRLSTQVKVLLDIASSLSDESNDGLKSPPPRSPMTSPRPDRHARGPSLAGPHFEIQEELHKTLDVNNLLGQAVDVANEKIVKVLKVRAEQASQLPLDLFLRYFTLNLYFANECEAISGRSGTSLKTVVNGHIKEFVQKNRDAEMQKLAQGMESDQWNAKDFTDENAEVLKQLVDSSTQDSALWAEKTSIWIPYSDFSNAAQDTPAPETNGTGKDKTRTASIEDEKFNLPNSAILCLNGMANFVQLMAGIPSMTTDIASSLLSYLQLFNSRCTQLILGAGATKSAGLKNITTKHLALASQALSFIYTLVPHIREFVRRHAGSGAGVSGLMGEFDKVKRQLQEHQDNIHQKLVEIMSGRASAHSKSMTAIDWDSESSPAPHQYMETLAKETTTLHRVLTKNLPESSIQMIMFPVFSSYKEQLGKALNEANPRTEAGKQSMLADLDLFSTKLGKLDGFSDAGDYLKGIVQAKEVKTPKPSTSTQETKAEDDTVAEAESKTSAGTVEAPTDESDKAEEKKSDDS